MGLMYLHPDRVFCNGHILTMADDVAAAEAVAVMNGLIVAIGSDEDVKGLAGPDTEIVDLNGQAMLPGFYDTHGHFPSAGLVQVSSVNCNCPPMGSIETIDDIV
ncbi:MAG: amidohydrolase, partial [Candidatus Latescibacteria bacterium]|nr:amidohydrolase [Candidatus Latescibacterota bacterium]